MAIQKCLDWDVPKYKHVPTEKSLHEHVICSVPAAIYLITSVAVLYVAKARTK